MNRRKFLEAGIAGFSGLPALYHVAFAQKLRSPTGRHIRTPDLVRRALTQAYTGFPSVKPLFAGLFAPGNTPVQMILSESWADFTAQAQQLGGSYTLSCFTAIQNMNRVFYYGAFQQGSSGTPYLFQTSDASAFQQTFSENQESYTLVDFNVSWQAGKLVYSGCWVTAAPPKAQTLVLGITGGFDGLVSQAQQQSNQQSPMQISRVQAYPQSAGALLAALFESGTRSPALLEYPVETFAAQLNAHTNSSLLGLGYDPVAGNLVACLSNTVPGAQFFIDQDWDALVAMAANNGLVPKALAVYPDAPSFDDYFEANLAPFVMGYAYAVARNGQIIANGGGYARSPYEPENPGVAFTADSRLTLASVSKAITGVALEVLCIQKGISLDEPFLPLLAGKVTAPAEYAADIGTITLRHLASMQSGLFHETQGTEGPPDLPSGDATIWTEIDNYLAMPPYGPPGVSYYYDNTNFAILQGVIDQVSGTDYTAWVTNNVLIPAGMDPSVVNAAPVSPESAAPLIYSGPGDKTPGYQYGEFTLVGVSGWVSSARELVKLLAALRGPALLPQPIVSEMFADSIGWNLPGNVPPASAPAPYIGNFGTYYWKEGGLTENGQSLSTFLVRLAEGYDLAVLINSGKSAPTSINQICFNAFDARGVSAANLPEGGSLVQAVVNAASYAPGACPGAFVAVLGSGFTTQPATDWSAAIGKGTSLPTELAGVTVRVGSVDAWMEYVSPGQVNVLLPASLPTGILNVELTTPDGGSTSSVLISAAAPGLFTYNASGRNYATAIFGVGNGVVYAAAPGAIPGVSSRPANSGDIVLLYATGLGATNPPWPDGTVFEGSYPVAGLNEVQVTIGGVQSQVFYAGMIEPGLFQIDIAIPGELASGDQPVLVIVNGTASQASVFLTIG